jgi:predicted TPR repeat methyltransferase
MTHDGPMDGGFLDRVYDVDGGDAAKRLYADWAESYDADLIANGYASPSRCAEALAGAVEDLSAPLLDLGCGTGLSGEAFRVAGFSTIDGTDFSPEMLEVARRKEVYRELFLSDHENPLPVEPGAYANMAAVGVFSPGHAPATLIDEVLSRLPSGGRFVFTLNDHALEDPSYEGRINELCDSGGAQCLFRERGPHLPKIDLQSTVYVLGKP